MPLSVSIEESRVFQGLEPAVLDRITAIAIEKRYSVDDRIFTEGDPASEIYVLSEGQVELVYIIHARSPVPIKIAHLMPGDLFGWSALAGNEKFTGNARAVVESAAFKLPVAPLVEILEAHPAAGYRVMSRMTHIIARRMHDVRSEVRWFLSSL
jgi:CRP-like cAMP-binding protein